MTTVTFGEVMLRLTPPGFERFLQSAEFVATFGGAEANVAVAVAGWGLPSAYVTVLPEKNALADAVIGELPRSAWILPGFCVARDAWEFILWKREQISVHQKSSMIANSVPSPLPNRERFVGKTYCREQVGFTLRASPLRSASRRRPLRLSRRGRRGRAGLRCHATLTIARISGSGGSLPRR